MILASQYFIDPATTVIDGDGSSAKPFKTFDAAKAVISLLKTTPEDVGAITISILGDIDGEVNPICDWEENGSVYLIIDGSQAQVAGTSAGALAPGAWYDVDVLFDWRTRHDHGQRSCRNARRFNDDRSTHRKPTPRRHKLRQGSRFQWPDHGPDHFERDTVHHVGEPVQGIREHALRVIAVVT